MIVHCISRLQFHVSKSLSRSQFQVVVAVVVVVEKSQLLLLIQLLFLLEETDR